MAPPSKQGRRMGLLQHDSIGLCSEIVQFLSLRIRKSPVFIFVQQLPVAVCIRFSLPETGNAPKGTIIQTFQCRQIRLVFGRYVLPSGRTTHLDGSDDDLIQGLFCRPSRLLQSDVDTLGQVYRYFL